MKINPTGRYAASHEWVRKEGEWIAYWITVHAQDSLSDIVYVELPGVGEKFARGDVTSTVESVKAASDLYIPMAGEIAEVNEAAISAPELLNKDPYSEGWLVKFKPSDPGEWNSLLTPEAYEQLSGE